MADFNGNTADPKVIEQIKGYLKRLGKGEALESVRKDFIREFKELDASEIMHAEQELLREGTPLQEVQRLCDVHSALFHRVTNTEQKKTAEQMRASAASIKEQKLAAAAQKMEITGHPLRTLHRENNALEQIIEQCQKELQQETVALEPFYRLRELAVHYAKKGDLLYPHLQARYGISGPSDVMWTVDDEIRDELTALMKSQNQEESWRARMQSVLTRISEMIYKEENILFPMCTLHFTEEEWYAVYQDAKDYSNCFGVEMETWEAAENARQKKEPSLNNEEIVLAGGHLTIMQLNAVLNTIPLEISFVDVDNKNRYFNEGPKVFKRPGMAIDREVFSCHPPKIAQKVKHIIEGFRSGTMDQVPVWMDKNGRTMLVTYMAVRDSQGNYLGTMELVQDMEFAKEHFVR